MWRKKVNDYLKMLTEMAGAKSELEFCVAVLRGMGCPPAAPIGNEVHIYCNKGEEQLFLGRFTHCDGYYIILPADLPSHFPQIARKFLSKIKVKVEMAVSPPPALRNYFLFLYAVNATLSGAAGGRLNFNMKESKVVIETNAR